MRLAAAIVMAAALASGAIPAAAHAQETFLTEREARRTFFGVDLGGVHQPSGSRWRECINRDGATRFWFGERVDEGRMTVRPDGALCFSYASTQFQQSSCWRVQAAGPGTFRFQGVDGGSDIYIARTARRVAGCNGEDVPIS